MLAKGESKMVSKDEGGDDEGGAGATVKPDISEEGERTAQCDQCEGSTINDCQHLVVRECCCR